jgi:hypothetical protein
LLEITVQRLDFPARISKRMKTWDFRAAARFGVPDVASSPPLIDTS